MSRVPVLGGAERAELTAELRGRHPRHAARVNAASAVDIGGPAVSGDRRRADRLGQRAQQRTDHHLALLVVEEHGAVGRQGADHRALGEDDVDVAPGPAGERRPRIEQVLERHADGRLGIERGGVDASASLAGGTREIDLGATPRLVTLTWMRYSSRRRRRRSPRRPRPPTRRLRSPPAPRTCAPQPHRRHR